RSPKEALEGTDDWVVRRRAVVRTDHRWRCHGGPVLHLGSPMAGGFGPALGTGREVAKLGRRKHEDIVRAIELSQRCEAASDLHAHLPHFVEAALVDPVVVVFLEEGA